MSADSGNDGAELDLNLLPTLHMLIQTQSVTRSADRLGLSQPSVSRSLGRLREAFNDPLLIKTNGGMSLSRRARELGEPLQRWLNATRSLLRVPAGDDPSEFSGVFRVATTDYGLLTVVRPALQAIITLAPNVRLEVVPLSTDNLNELTTGAVDIVITGYDPLPGRMFERFLYVEDYRCLMRRDHPLLAGRAADDDSPLSLDDLTGWPHVAAKVNDDDGDPVCSRLAAMGLSRRIAIRIPYFSAAPHMLLASDAIMVMPARASAQFARTCDLRSLPAPVELEPYNYWILWHERSRRDPATCWLIDRMALATVGATSGDQSA